MNLAPLPTRSLARRLIALLLVPCLALSSVEGLATVATTASAFSHSVISESERVGAKGRIGTVFQVEALSPLSRYFHTVIPDVLSPSGWKRFFASTTRPPAAPDNGGAASGLSLLPPQLFSLIQRAWRRFFPREGDTKPSPLPPALEDFLHFLRTHELSDAVLVLGAVQDVLGGNDVQGFKFTFQADSGADALFSRSDPDAWNPEMVERLEGRLEKAVQALGTTTGSLLKGGALFKGLPVQYVGPYKYPPEVMHPSHSGIVVSRDGQVLGLHLLIPVESLGLAVSGRWVGDVKAVKDYIELTLMPPAEPFVLRFVLRVENVPRCLYLKRSLGVDFERAAALLPPFAKWARNNPADFLKQAGAHAESFQRNLLRWVSAYPQQALADLGELGLTDLFRRTQGPGADALNRALHERDKGRPRGSSVLVALAVAGMAGLLLSKGFLVPSAAPGFCRTMASVLPSHIAIFWPWWAAIFSMKGLRSARSSAISVGAIKEIDDALKAFERVDWPKGRSAAAPKTAYDSLSQREREVIIDPISPQTEIREVLASFRLHRISRAESLKKLVALGITDAGLAEAYLTQASAPTAMADDLTRKPPAAPIVTAAQNVIYKQTFRFSANPTTWGSMADKIKESLAAAVLSQNWVHPLFKPSSELPFTSSGAMFLDSAIDNAVDAVVMRYLRKGRGYRGAITVQWKEPGSGINCVVSDNGVGFGKRTLEKLFITRGRGVTTKGHLRGRAYIFGSAGDDVAVDYRSLIEENGGEIEIVTRNQAASWRLIANPSTLAGPPIEPAQRFEQGTDVSFLILPPPQVKPKGSSAASFWYGILRARGYSHEEAWKAGLYSLGVEIPAILLAGLALPLTPFAAGLGVFFLAHAGLVALVTLRSPQAPPLWKALLKNLQTPLIAFAFYGAASYLYPDLYHTFEHLSASGSLSGLFLFAAAGFTHLLLDSRFLRPKPVEPWWTRNGIKQRDQWVADGVDLGPYGAPDAILRIAPRIRWADAAAMTLEELQKIGLDHDVALGQLPFSASLWYQDQRWGIVSGYETNEGINISWFATRGRAGAAVYRYLALEAYQNGQVLFTETASNSHLRAIQKAGLWMVLEFDNDGTWDSFVARAKLRQPRSGREIVIQPGDPDIRDNPGLQARLARGERLKVMAEWRPKGVPAAAPAPGLTWPPSRSEIRNTYNRYKKRDIVDGRFGLNSVVFNPGLRNLLVREIGQYHAGQTLLSIGVGSGVLEDVLVKRWQVRRVLGVDLADELIRPAAAKDPRLSAAVGDAHVLPVGDARVDGVLLILSISHMDHAQVIREAFRVLRPGGMIHICGGLPETIAPEEWGTWRLAFPVEEYRRALEAQGFQETEEVSLSRVAPKRFYVRARKPLESGVKQETPPINVSPTAAPAAAPDTKRATTQELEHSLPVVIEIRKRLDDSHAKGTSGSVVLIGSPGAAKSQQIDIALQQKVPIFKLRAEFLKDKDPVIRQRYSTDLLLKVEEGDWLRQHLGEINNKIRKALSDTSTDTVIIDELDLAVGEKLEGPEIDTAKHVVDLAGDLKKSGFNVILSLRSKGQRTTELMDYLLERGLLQSQDELIVAGYFSKGIESTILRKLAISHEASQRFMEQAQGLPVAYIAFFLNLANTAVGNPLRFPELTQEVLEREAKIAIQANYRVAVATAPRQVVELLRRLAMDGIHPDDAVVITQKEKLLDTGLVGERNGVLYMPQFVKEVIKASAQHGPAQNAPPDGGSGPSTPRAPPSPTTLTPAAGSTALTAGPPASPERSDTRQSLASRVASRRAAAPAKPGPTPRSRWQPLPGPVAAEAAARLAGAPARAMAPSFPGEWEAGRLHRREGGDPERQLKTETAEIFRQLRIQIERLYQQSGGSMRLMDYARRLECPAEFVKRIAAEMGNPSLLPARDAPIDTWVGRLKRGGFYWRDVPDRIQWALVKTLAEEAGTSIAALTTFHLCNWRMQALDGKVLGGLGEFLAKRYGIEGPGRLNRAFHLKKREHGLDVPEPPMPASRPAVPWKPREGIYVDWEVIYRILPEARHPSRLTKAQEQALALEMQAGNKAAHEALVAYLKPRVRGQADYYVTKYRRPMDRDILLAIGLQALERGLDRFDPSRNKWLWTFLRVGVRRLMVRYLTKELRARRWLIEQQRLEQSDQDEDWLARQEAESSYGRNPEAAAVNESLIRTLRSALDRLGITQRERYIVQERFRGRQWKEIAHDDVLHGISHQRVHQIFYACMVRLFKQTNGAVDLSELLPTYLARKRFRARYHPEGGTVARATPPSQPVPKLRERMDGFFPNLFFDTVRGDGRLAQKTGLLVDPFGLIRLMGVKNPRGPVPPGSKKTVVQPDQPPTAPAGAPERLTNSRGETFDQVWARLKEAGKVRKGAVDPREWPIHNDEERSFARSFSQMRLAELEGVFKQIIEQNGIEAGSQVFLPLHQNGDYAMLRAFIDHLSAGPLAHYGVAPLEDLGSFRQMAAMMIDEPHRRSVQKILSSMYRTHAFLRELYRRWSAPAPPAAPPAALSDGAKGSLPQPLGAEQIAACELLDGDTLLLIRYGDGHVSRLRANPGWEFEKPVLSPERYGLAVFHRDRNNLHYGILAAVRGDRQLTEVVERAYGRRPERPVIWCRNERAAMVAYGPGTRNLMNVRLRLAGETSFTTLAVRVTAIRQAHLDPEGRLAAIVYEAERRERGRRSTYTNMAVKGAGGMTVQAFTASEARHSVQGVTNVRLAPDRGMVEFDWRHGQAIKHKRIKVGAPPTPKGPSGTKVSVPVVAGLLAGAVGVASTALAHSPAADATSNRLGHFSFIITLLLFWPLLRYFAREFNDRELEIDELLAEASNAHGAARLTWLMLKAFLAPAMVSFIGLIGLMSFTGLLVSVLCTWPIQAAVAIRLGVVAAISAGVFGWGFHLMRSGPDFLRNYLGSSRPSGKDPGKSENNGGPGEGGGAVLTLREAVRLAIGAATGLAAGLGLYPIISWWAAIAGIELTGLIWGSESRRGGNRLATSPATLLRAA